MASGGKISWDMDAGDFSMPVMTCCEKSTENDLMWMGEGYETHYCGEWYKAVVVIPPDAFIYDSAADRRGRLDFAPKKTNI